VQTVSARTGDIVIATSDVDGLAALLAEATSGNIDGGDYEGVVLSPTITITAQPASYAASVNVGATWSQTGYGTSYWRGLAYASGRWVLVGTQYNSPAGYYTAISTDAVNWTQRGNSTSPQFAVYEVATNGTAFLAVGDGKYATSSDGLTWTGSTLPITAYGVAFGNSRYLAVGASSTFSTDGGTTWSSAVSLPATCVVVAYGTSGFVALRSGASATAYLSTDGSSWSSVTLPASTTWRSIASANGVYIALRSGTTAARSTDGTAWTTVTMPSSRTWHGASYSGGRWWAFGNGSTAAACSTDGGQTWTAVTLPASGNWIASAGGAQDVLAANAGTGSHAYSVGSSAATFTVAAASTATLSYQWQLSTDAGTTFSNISGATSATLSLSGLTTGDSGKRYRCVVSATGVSSVTSNSATLTVT
jgi:hypothetical protein